MAGSGSASAMRLREKAPIIAVVYAQSANEAGAVADEMRKHSVDAQAFQCDLTQPAQIAAPGR